MVNGGDVGLVVPIIKQKDSLVFLTLLSGDHIIQTHQKVAKDTFQSTNNLYIFDIFMTKLPINYPEEYTKWIVHFFGRDFFVTPDVLIPRLETECLVKRARQILQAPTNLPNYQPTTVIDIGSGSGIIGTSVADLVDEVIFLDISETALEVTKKNFQIHFPDKKAQFIISDLLSNLPSYHPTNQHPINTTKCTFY